MRTNWFTTLQLFLNSARFTREYQKTRPIVVCPPNLVAINLFQLSLTMGTATIGKDAYSYYSYCPPIIQPRSYTNQTCPQLHETRSSPLPKARDMTQTTLRKIRLEKPPITHSLSSPVCLLSTGTIQDSAYLTGEKIGSNQWDTFLKQAAGPDTFNALNKGEFYF